MKIVIDISEEMYKEYMSTELCKGLEKTIVYDLLNTIKNGTPLPEHHGRLLIISEDRLKENLINLDFSCQKWICEVDLSSATVAIIEAEGSESLNTEFAEIVEEIVMQADCKNCKHSDNGKCAYTEECHDCMWKSKHEQRICDSHYGMWGGACEDAISRKEVIKLLEKEDWADTVTGVLALPLVQPQRQYEKPRRKPGHWKWELASNGWANHICSECGFKENTDIHVKLNWRYCPRCGAEMTNGGDENERQTESKEAEEGNKSS